MTALPNGDAIDVESEPNANAPVGAAPKVNVVLALVLAAPALAVDAESEPSTAASEMVGPLLGASVLLELIAVLVAVADGLKRSGAAPPNVNAGGFAPNNNKLPPGGANADARAAA